MADEIKESTEVAAETAPEEAAPKKKKDWKRLRLPIVIAAVCVVTVVGVAGWAWHATPECCNLICHSSMGKYYDSYVSDTDTLVYKHRASTNNQCLGCHEATLPQMLHEVQLTLAGDVSSPMEKVTFTNEFCLQSGCHSGAGVMPGATESSTADWSFDPHSTQHGVQQCNSCHRMHDQSVFTCASCHTSYEAPSSWTTEATVGDSTVALPEGWTVSDYFEAAE